MKLRLVLLAATLAALPAFAAAQPPLLARGSVAPDFTAYKPDDSPVKLSDFHGKVVLIDFWATWCGPCKMAMPHMEAIHQKLAAQGLVVLGVCVWDQRPAFAKWQVTPEVPTSYLKVFDPAGRGRDSIASALYKVSGIPTFYLIGKDGRVMFTGIGSGDRTESELNGALKHAGFEL